MRRLIAFSILIFMLYTSVTLAIPPSTTYSPGETLTPNCAPGAANCTVTPPATNNSILSDTGVLTMGGTQGDTNNENILLDFETTADTIGISTSTGVTDWDFGDIALSNIGGITLTPTEGISSQNDGGTYNSKNTFTHTYTEPLGAVYMDELISSSEINFSADPGALYVTNNIDEGIFTHPDYSFDLSQMNGIIASAWHYGSGTVTNTNAASLSTHNKGTGIITDARTAQFVYSNTGAGSIGTATAIVIESPSNDTSNDSITNAYGIYIQPQDRGSNRYQLYSEGTAPSYFAGPILTGTTAGITASTTQAQGNQALTSSINEISTVTNPNDTITLPTAAAGLCIVIINNGAESLQIFPAGDDDLGSGPNIATTLLAGGNIRFCAYDATNWEAV